MTVIGFSEEEIRQVLEVAALVLKLGNVELINEFQANGVPASGIRDGRGLYPISSLNLLLQFLFSHHLQHNRLHSKSPSACSEVPPQTYSFRTSCETHWNEVGCSIDLGSGTL